MRRPFSAIFALSLALIAPSWAESPRLPIGFSGRAVSQAYSAFLDTLFLGEADGYLCAWTPAEGAFSGRRRFGRDPIALIACHPENGELCVVESDAISRHTAFILRYSDGAFEELKAIKLAERPDFLCYSPKGGLLAFAARTARGILLLETQDYGQLPGFPSDCGPTSFLAIGNSEKSLLQYAPQGRITYRQIPQGTVLQEAKTLANLASLWLSADKQSLFASYLGNFASIDSMSGKVRFTIPLKGLSSITPLGGDGKALLCFLDGRRQTIDIGEKKAPTAYLSSSPPFASVVSMGKGQSAIDTEGGVQVSSGNGDFTRIEGEGFFKAQAVTVYGDERGPGFILSGSDGARFILERDLSPEDPETAGIGPIPVEGLGGSEAVGTFGSKIFFSVQADSKIEVARMDGLSGRPSRLRLEGSSPAFRISLNEYGSLAVQRNGVVSEIGSGKAKRLTSISGIQDAVAISPSKIAIGKIRGGSLPSPLLFYSLATGELSPAALDAITVLRLRFAGPDRLYAICVEEADGETMTSIRRILDGEPAETPLASAPGENFNAQLAFDPSGNAYFSFGVERSLTRADRNGEECDIELDDLPEKIAVGESSACVLHADGSFSVIDLETLSRSKLAIDREGGLLRLY